MFYQSFQGLALKLTNLFCIPVKSFFTPKKMAPTTSPRKTVTQSFKKKKEKKKEEFHITYICILMNTS